MSRRSGRRSAPSTPEKGRSPRELQPSQGEAWEERVLREPRAWLPAVPAYRPPPLFQAEAPQSPPAFALQPLGSPLRRLILLSLAETCVKPRRRTRELRVRMRGVPVRSKRRSFGWETTMRLD